MTPKQRDELAGELMVESVEQEAGNVGDGAYTADLLRRAAVEQERLRGMMPKTKNGVQWYGQAVWIITGNEEIVSNEMFGEFRYTHSIFNGDSNAKEWQACFNVGFGLMAPVRCCYSTRAAAEAAGGK